MDIILIACLCYYGWCKTEYNHLKVYRRASCNPALFSLERIGTVPSNNAYNEGMWCYVLCRILPPFQSPNSVWCLVWESHEAPLCTAAKTNLCHECHHRLLRCSTLCSWQELSDMSEAGHNASPTPTPGGSSGSIPNKPTLDPKSACV